MIETKEYLEYWQLQNDCGEVLRVISARGVFHQDKDHLIQVVSKEDFTKLQLENQMLREALEFYERCDHIKEQGCETYVGKCDKDVDHGEVARVALAKETGE
jgi:hypothetical protein